MEQRRKIIEIVQQIRETLSNRPKDKRMDVFLEMVFEKYNNLLNDYCLENCLSEMQQDKIKQIENRIIVCLKDYFRGCLMGALNEIQCLLQDLKSSGGSNLTILNKGEIWYRGRIKDEGISFFNKKDIVK